jgi:hypothetical protein
VVWLIWCSVSIYPHHISYVNEFIGMENGYKHFAGSNIDFGQDLYYLIDYFRANNITNPKISYFGPPIYKKGLATSYYGYYGAEELGCGPTNGTIAISESMVWYHKDCYG